MYVSTPGNREAQAKVERPIRTITEASRAVMTHSLRDLAVVKPERSAASCLRQICCAVHSCFYYAICQFAADLRQGILCADINRLFFATRCLLQIN